MNNLEAVVISRHCNSFTAVPIVFNYNKKNIPVTLDPDKMRCVCHRTVRHPASEYIKRYRRWSRNTIHRRHTRIFVKTLLPVTNVIAFTDVLSV
jgi:hypothetical protein